MDYVLKYYPKRKENDVRNDYDIGYLDGRNHAIALIAKRVKKCFLIVILLMRYENSFRQRFVRSVPF